MIVVQVADWHLRRAVVRAADPEEDVITDAKLGADAIEWGFPRIVVRDHEGRRPAMVDSKLRIVEIDDDTLRRWEVERRGEELPLTRTDFVARRLAALFRSARHDATWVDRALGDLARASGQRLPAPLRSFTRRVLEFPSHYTTLHPMAETCGTTRGALKARFRRRNLSSPSTYLRWLRILAVAEALSDRSVTVSAAARHLGFTSGGNLCRMMWSVAGMTPTEARTLVGWNRLLLSFTWTHLSADALEGWASLDDLFIRRAA